MKKKRRKKIILILIIIVLVLLSLILFVFPWIIFHQNEKRLAEAGKEYYELNMQELPVGERVATVTLNKLYSKSFIKSDLYIPYTNKVCSINNSWVKVRKENNEYKYYTYLECGIYKTKIDHTGPTIHLKGDKELIIGRGEEYIEPGIESINDKEEGKVSIDTAVISGMVDTSTIGTYEIKYVAFDSLKNKTTVIRTVNVVQKLEKTIRDSLGEKTIFIGNPTNNYLKLSNMLFRIYGIDSDNNIVIVSDSDVANVNYSGLNEWLEYYYNHLMDSAKELIVEKEYCNMKVTNEELGTKECSEYTEKRKVYIPSIVEINNVQTDNGNYMKPMTLSWVSNTKDDKEGYLTRNVFFGEPDNSIKYKVELLDHNFGVRPMMTIKGDALIIDGNGTPMNPYIFGETKKAKNGSPINERYTGEYVSINSVTYRIIEVLKDGTTKVISNEIVGYPNDNIKCSANKNSDKIVYNPKDKTSVGYFINQTITAYIDTTLFVNHEIEVPIYKDLIMYGKEKSTKKYTVKLSAPNMYELFSTKSSGFTTSESYWLINNTEKERFTGLIYKGGVPFNTEIILDNEELNVRVVGYLNKNTVISGGAGTEESPYILK